MFEGCRRFAIEARAGRGATGSRMAARGAPSRGRSWSSTTTRTIAICSLVGSARSATRPRSGHDGQHALRPDRREVVRRDPARRDDARARRVRGPEDPPLAPRGDRPARHHGHGQGRQRGRDPRPGPGCQRLCDQAARLPGGGRPDPDPDLPEAGRRAGPDRLERRLAERNVDLEEANSRMSRDLRAAARIQESLLPGPRPTSPTFLSPGRFARATSWPATASAPSSSTSTGWPSTSST